MTIEHETPEYAFVYDGLYGVGRFKRKLDGALSLWETGSECQELRENLNSMASRHRGGDFEDLFNSIAQEYNYDNE